MSKAIPYPSNPLQDDSSHDNTKPAAKKKSTTPGGQEEVKWEVVAETPGIPPASIIAGRLESEGVPARYWQESAGQALGLTVGLLGTAYVIVPEAYVEQASAILQRLEEEE